MKKIILVRVLSEYRVELKFNDSTTGTADLAYLVGKGVFARWQDYDFFRRVRIGSSGELTWDDQIDLCPDSLYLKVTDKTPEEVFPALQQEAVNA